MAELMLAMCRVILRGFFLLESFEITFSLNSDHPLTHLMKSVFTMHNKKRFHVFLYATSPTDGSSYREHYERQTDFHFNDVSSWSINSIVEKIMQDQIHIRK